MENYEQKYKEALKVMESLYNVVKYQSNSDALLTRQTIEKAFHELKENEDGSIRKTLINFVEQYGDNYYGQIAKASAISWLEKQGGEKPWSEEDDSRICQIIDWLSICKTYNPDQKSVCDISMQITWLKSIKPNHWKPSEQNIKDLEWCADLVKDKMGVGFHRLQVFINELKNL